VNRTGQNVKVTRHPIQIQVSRQLATRVLIILPLPLDTFSLPQDSLVHCSFFVIHLVQSCRGSILGRVEPPFLVHVLFVFSFNLCEPTRHVHHRTVSLVFTLGETFAIDKETQRRICTNTLSAIISKTIVSCKIFSLNSPASYTSHDDQHSPPWQRQQVAPLSRYDCIILHCTGVCNRHSTFPSQQP